MKTDFRAISDEAKREAAARNLTHGDASSYAAGYEIGRLQRIICELEAKIAKQQGDVPCERHNEFSDPYSQAERLTHAIDDALTDGEVCTDAIEDALINGLPIEFDGRFTLDDGSVWSVVMYLTARKHRGAQPQPCGRCNGSGEGMTERSICSTCRGSGTVEVEVADAD